MASIDERVARIEGGYEHLATKVDIAELCSEVRTMKWMLGLGLMVVVSPSPQFCKSSRCCRLPDGSPYLVGSSSLLNDRSLDPSWY